MAQRISEQVVEWLTAGGTSFTPQVDYPVQITNASPAATTGKNGTTGVVNLYNTGGKIWSLMTTAASATLKNSQIVLSTAASNATTSAGAAAAIELFRGTNASWQIFANDKYLTIRNNLTATETAGTTYTDYTKSFYIEGPRGDTYIYGTLTVGSQGGSGIVDTNYLANGANGLNVEGGSSFKGKMYIANTTDATLSSSSVGGSLATQGGVWIGKKLYVKDSAEATSKTQAAVVIQGGLAVGKNIYAERVNAIATTADYLTCDTAPETVAKTIKCDTFRLVSGTEVMVKFDNTNTAANPTLNINSTGAKAIWKDGIRLTTQAISSNFIYHLMYNGSRWEVINDWDYLLVNSPTVAGTATKVATCEGFSLTDGVHVYVRFAAQNTTSAPKLNINGTGAKSLVMQNTGETLTYQAITDTILYHLVYDATANVWQVVNTWQLQPATCGSAADATAKTVTVPGFVLQPGQAVDIKFSATNSVANPTLNINSTGAKPMYKNGVRLTMQAIATNITYHFVYDGTNYNAVNDWNVDMATSSTAAGTAAKVVTIPGYVRTTGSHILVKFSAQNTTAEPTLNVNGLGAVQIDKQGTRLIQQALTTSVIYDLMWDGSKWQVVNDWDLPLGSCTTAAATVAKTVTIPGFILYNGATINVKFSALNSAANPTLNVNSSGDKPIVYNGIQVQSNGLVDGNIYTMVYDGTNWCIVNNREPKYISCSTAAATAAKTASCPGYVHYDGAIINVKFTAENTATAPTLNINGCGACEMTTRDDVRLITQAITTGVTYQFMLSGAKYILINEIKPKRGSCSTAAGTAAKVVTCPGFALYTGATAEVTFTATNTHQTPTLNINSTGAKPIYWADSTTGLANKFMINHTYQFIYDGSQYRVLDDHFQHVIARGTTTTTGLETIITGNSLSSTADQNMSGRFGLYGFDSGIHYLRTQLTGTTSRTYYLPNFAGDGYLAHVPSASAVGSNTQPVWVAANGRITALTYTANRLYYSQNTSNFVAGTYYADGTKVTINGTAVPENSSNFQVIGTSTLRTTLPQATNTYNLGSTSLYWNNLYSQYIITPGMRVMRYELIHSETGNSQAAGWRQTCVVQSAHNYANFILLLTGGWSTGAPAVATISIQMRNGLAGIKVLHSTFTGRPAQIRLRKLDTNTAYLDLYLPANSATSGTYSAIQGTFIGNVNVTNVAATNTVTTATADVLATVDLGTAVNATVYSGTANRLAYYNAATTVISANSLYTTGANLGINATTTTATPTGGSSTTFTLYVNGTSHTTGVARSNGGFYVYRSATGGGFYLYHNGSITAQMYIATLGTASNGTTQGDQGDTYLILGNSIARAAATATSGANNARGILRLYGTGTTYQQIVPQATASNRTIYLSAYDGTQYLAHVGGTGAVGGNTQPVYVAANGRLTAITYTANRLYYPSSTTTYVASSSYADATHIVVNGTTYAQTLSGGSATTNFQFAVLGNAFIRDTVYTNTAYRVYRTAVGNAFTLYGSGQVQHATINWNTAGTTSTTGRTYLSLGNSTAAGTANNSYGDIVLYGTGANYIVIRPSDVTTNLTLGASASHFTMARLWITADTDVGGTATSASPFMIGPQTGTHLEMDGNEILAKTNGTTPGTLNLQDTTGTVAVNGSGGLYVSSGYIRTVKYGTANPSGTASAGSLYFKVIG